MDIIFYIRRVALVMIFSLPVTGEVVAQTGAGSVTTENGHRNVGTADSIFEFAETLYIGPNANWQVAGTVVIYSKNVWIAPTASISGSGKMIIANPGTNLFYPGMLAGQTTVDGNNGNHIGLVIEHHNPGNIILSDISDPGYGTVNPAGPLAAALNISRNFSFETDYADVLLNGNDFSFDVNATISNYGVNRMVVTGNSIAGHMIKRNAGSSNFVFPIGIAEGDYTPATITGTNTFHVSVTDYAASAAPVIVPEEGMDRAWHIYGGTATNVTLQHNSPDTDGSDYIDTDAFITQHQGSGVWGIAGFSDYVSSGLHSNTSVIPLTIPSLPTIRSWYTKSSDMITPLPVGFLTFDAYRKNVSADLVWMMASEQNTAGFDIERSTDGENWTNIGFVKSRSEQGNSSEQLDYLFNDLKPRTGYNYYRLKQIDYDGNYRHSPVRFVQFDEKISIYPTYVKDNVVISGLSGSEVIAVYDFLGRKVKDVENNDSVITVDLSNLSNGAYRINIMGKEKRESQVIVISK